MSLPQDYDWLYFDDKDLIFHRVTLQNSFSDQGIPRNTSVLSCEIAYNKFGPYKLTVPIFPIITDHHQFNFGHPITMENQ